MNKQSHRLTWEETTVRFLSKVYVSDTERCWPWAGRCNKDGYGQFDYDNRSESAHRFMWKLHHKSDIPEGMVICHSCDNPPCCNPHHLFLGTVQDNVKDRDNKGRQRSHKGEFNNKAKLDEFKVKLIWKLRKENKTYNEIASLVGVSNGCINHILNGRHWGWVSHE